MTTIQSDFPSLYAHNCRDNPQWCADAFNRLRDRAIEMEKALARVANLNPDAGEIGAGMLKTIVEEARRAIQ